MIKVYSALQIGEYHTNHCDDYLFVGDIGHEMKICAVMDGCTMAPDSYFAATLVGKILKKIVTEKGYELFYKPGPIIDLNAYLKSILKDIFKELNITRNQLLLDAKELLTTLSILLIDVKTNKGIVLAIGDGLVCNNGVITDFDQDNKPDYLGFHLDDAFDEWYDRQTQKLHLDTIEDISIATDGIFTFTPIKNAEAEGLINPLEYMLFDKGNIENEDMLHLKLKKIEHSYGLKPTDDFAMIRVISFQ